MSRPSQPAVLASGMTLIEILVALSISTLILTVALSIYFTFSGSLRRLGNPQHRETTLALDNLRHDLTDSVQASFTNFPAFELESVPVGMEGRFRSALTFHTARSLPGYQSVPQMTIHRLRYSVQDNPGTSPAFVRESVTVWGPDAMAPPSSNVVLHDIANFEVNVWVNTGWTNRWKSTPGRLLPRAARVRIDWMETTGSKTASLVIFIPAGNSIPATNRRPETVTGQTIPLHAGNAAPTPVPPRANERTSPRDLP